MAGAFGPLALFWLVLGFFQQGKELRASVDTLELQAEELRNSVQQQSMLVETARKEHEFQYKKYVQERLPNLTILSKAAQKTAQGYRIDFYLTNIQNEPCEVLVSVLNKEIEVLGNEVANIPAGERQVFTLRSDQYTEDITLHVEARGPDNHAARITFQLPSDLKVQREPMEDNEPSQ